MLTSFFLHRLPAFDSHVESVSYVRMFTKNSKYDDHATWSVTQILPSSSHPFLSGVFFLHCSMVNPYTASTVIVGAADVYLIIRVADLVDLVNIILGAR